MRGGGNTNWIMVMASALTMFWANAEDTEDHCLPGGKHKANPSAEEELGVCQIYAENACCTPEVAQELSKANSGSWNRCGSLSNSCEEYFRQLDCFYHCSPIAAEWPHPQQTIALMAVPLCQGFCDQWYNACREDLTCPGNWPWGADEHNCSQECHSFGQMYKDGKELCENIWDDAFIVSTDPCQCLMLDASDTAFSTSYSHLKDSNSLKEVLGSNFDFSCQQLNDEPYCYGRSFPHQCGELPRIKRESCHTPAIKQGSPPCSSPLQDDFQLFPGSPSGMKSDAEDGVRLHESKGANGKPEAQERSFLKSVNFHLQLFLAHHIRLAFIRHQYLLIYIK